jgi:adenylosuccinate lyase
MTTNEWLEGDVSTSAARKRFWPQMFGEVDELLDTWQTAITLWEPDEEALEADLDASDYEMRSGLWLQRLVNLGVARVAAHEWLRRFYRGETAVQVDPLLHEVIHGSDKGDPGVGWAGSIVDAVVKTAEQR